MGKHISAHLKLHSARHAEALVGNGDLRRGLIDSHDKAAVPTCGCERVGGPAVSRRAGARRAAVASRTPMIDVVVPPQQPTSRTTSRAVTCRSAALRYSTTFHVTTVGDSPLPSLACSAGKLVLPIALMPVKKIVSPVHAQILSTMSV